MGRESHGPLARVARLALCLILLNQILTLKVAANVLDEPIKPFKSTPTSNVKPEVDSESASDSEYLIGAGIADITGPAADINLMGYAKPNQEAGGIHLRIFSRSVIIEDKEGKRMLYTSLDNGMISQLLRVKVLERLADKFGHLMFNETNVMMSATHTHSAPGGLFQYMLYNIPSGGFISQTLEALVDGIVRSVDRAHDNMTLGKIYFAEGNLIGASVNRSPTSYANNPSEERALYDQDTDKTMYLLRMVDKHDKPIAMINWFAVHGTSMNNTNHLISGDNKGYASLLFEQEMNPPGTLPGKGKFVAIFAQANEGDVSPNTRGPRCIDTGLPCDMETSTCGNPPKNELCIAFGPGKDMFESTKIIAHKQYFKARDLFEDKSSQVQIRGPIRYVHEHIDMSEQVVPPYKSAIELARKSKSSEDSNKLAQGDGNFHTCKASLGYSFAAGTTDGPGAFDFRQGNTVSSRYWNMVRDFLRRPSEESIECHKPKPILLATGEMDFPYMWHPHVVPTQILMVGQLAIVGLPGEFTTMAGRRVRNAVKKALISAHEDDDSSLYSDYDYGFERGDEKTVTLSTSQTQPTDLRSRNKRASLVTPDFKVVLSGLSNIYTSYVTTIEEYAVQRYEGASTLYGPHTLQAYINQFQKLASHLATGSSLAPNHLQPPDLTRNLFTIKAGVIFDGSPRGKDFGSTLEDANSTKPYKCGDTVKVSFVAGNPRNDLKQEDSFLFVDKLSGSGDDNWSTVATDASWDTKFIWERTSTIYGESKATIEWEIPASCEPGVYRIRHAGAWKSIFQKISQYSGKSSPFMVVAKPDDDIKPLKNLLHKATELESQMMKTSSDVQDLSVLHRDDSMFAPLMMMKKWLGWR